MKYYKKKNTPYIRRLFKTRKNSTVNAIKFLLIVSVVVAFVIPYNIYFSTGNYTSFGAHSIISLLWFAVVVVIIFPISAKNKELLPATKLKEYKRRILKRQSASNGSLGIKSKKMRISLIKTGLLSIILLSFFVNTPVFQLHPFELKSFSVTGEDSIFRTGESVSFSWDLMGTPKKAFIVFGDGNIEDIVDYCSQINGMTCGSLEHRYALQGKYTPILKVYYPGKTFSKNLDIWVENDAPLFSFAFNGEQSNNEGTLRTSSSPFQAFEDEQVNVTVALSNQTNQEGLTYQFHFGDHQVTSKKNSTSYAWINQGLYPVTITVIGSQGELSKETQYVEVLNKAPQAAFKITNGFDFAVGKEIEFTAKGSSDTLSDENNLRYVWDWGDGLMDYGKIVSHAYVEAGNYNVTLYVKDDDSLVNQISQIIEIDNSKPEIVLDDYNLENNTLTVNEGEEVLFTAISQDDDKAIFKLLFYWNFESQEFNASNFDGFELGGWKNRHVFEDDFEGTVSVTAIDPYEEYDSDYSNVRVINVAPQISVFDANIFANVSFQVYRNDTAKEADFTFNLIRDDDFYGKSLQSFSDSGESVISSNDTTLGFSLLNQWKVIVNTTEVLPANSSFQAFINLVFVNGQELALSSNQLFGGNYGEWEFDLSSEFFDEQNYSYKYPITIATQVFDPSIDEIQFSMSYQESKLLEISLSNALPISDAFTSQGIEYIVDIYEQDSKQFANITARKSVFSKLFDNHSFPLKEELEVDLNSLIDVYDLLQNNLGLLNLSIIDCLSADNSIDVYALDDDLGNSSLTVDFETKINVEMGNLTSLLNVLTSNYDGPTPFGKIGGFSSTAYEGERVKFLSKTNDEDVPGMTFMWDFGDGNFVYSEHAEYAWQDAGIYNVTLALADPFGNIHYDVKNITILPKAPEIVGPFAFQGTEGSTVTLDVEIYDTYKDSNNLEYFWYDNKGNLVSSDRKPVLLLNDGTYTYTLVVIDPSGQSSSKDITVTIHSLSPEIFVSSYMYHGIEGDFRFNADGKLELTAYGLDALLDSEKLFFSWTIRNGKKVYRIGDGRYQIFSKVTFYCTETTTYQGEVRVTDPEGNEKVATFQIVSVIDSTLDGIDDETEEMLQLSDGSSDADGDGLTDAYEMTVSNTSYLDPDSDGDLLWDGPTVNGSVGEQAISTNPLDWDCDDDFLSDGTEYFGWNITVAYFENTTNFHVTSDSLDNDTDNDGLSDYEEYYAGSNPRQADTDNDDLTDDIDPFPSNWDGDEDMLSDYEEIMRGTNYNNTDSDQDGLKDGEEVYGWGIGFFTNPLDADSDHDHISDSAEIKYYLVKLQDEGFDDLDKKVNFSAPISLHFPHHFEQAVAAQISFGISFGEYGLNATDSYGITDIDVQDLYVIITKKENGVLLANFSTNNTRYFSQVVDVTSIMNNLSLGYNYYGDYEIGIGIPGGYEVQEGCYPGTFSFEDDTVGGLPAGWVSSEGYGCDVEVLASLDGHEKVVELFDTIAGTTYSASIYDEFTPIDDGTIEVWLRYDGDAEHRFMQLFEDSSLAVGMSALYSSGGNFYDANNNLLQACNNDQWYHVKLEFDCSANTFSIWIDGVLRTEAGVMPADFDDDVGVLRFATRGWGSYSDYWMYIDAVGYSWNPSYNIGDNEEELQSDYQFLTEKGAYQGTYSFENDTVGGLPAGWVSHEGFCCDVEVLASLDGHGKVVELFDTNAGTTHSASIYDEFTPIDDGTIEVWLRYDGYAEHRFMQLFEDSSLAVGMSALYSSGGNFYDANNNLLQACNNDQWYHVKLEFDCSADTFSIWIDGVLRTEAGVMPVDFDDDVGVLRFATRGWGSYSDYWMYIDAVGYSWDPSYNIGDNKKNPLDAGCYLDYFELEFCRYLDPNDPDSDDDGILDGVEMGVLVEGTDLIDFEDYYLYNNLTQNAIGNFSAMYSFEDEVNGTTNANIVFIDSVLANSSCVATIVSEFEYHNKVLELSDENNGGKVYAYNTAFDRQNGTIEFWWAQTTDDQDSLVSLYDDGTGTALTLYMRDTGKFTWYDGAYHDVREYEENIWYHHKIAFNCSDGAKGTFTWYIDGVSEVTDINFDDNCQSLDKLMFGTDSGSNGYDAYFDAIGFTWNWTYWEGENYEEQLPFYTDIGHYTGTFSFENDIVGGLPADWVSYEGYSCDVEVLASLDGHGKVVELFDTDKGTTYSASIYDEFTPIDNGTIEVWLRYDGYTEHRYLQLFEDSSLAVGMSALYSSGGNFYDANNNLLQACNNDQWYHVKLEFNCSADTFSIWIDGVLRTEAGVMPVDFDDDVGVLRFATRGWGSYSDYWMYIDAVGYSWDHDYEIGDNLNSKGLELTAPDEYYLEIPHIGKVTDGQLDLEVKSNGNTEGSGKVFVQLIKQEMNLTKSDIVLINYCEEFNSAQQFFCQKSLDLSPYVTSGQVYGTYHLKIQAFSTVSTDIFNLTQFEIETDTYVLADFDDTIAWITDPAEHDTDGDGWSDNYEIFTKGTSPVSVDSDGDDSWDPYDRDPLRDVMLEINPFKGIFRNLAIGDLHALLQISVAFTFGDNEYFIVTPVSQGTEYANGFGYYQTAYFGDHYYVNIDDDTIRQSNTITMHLQMWHVRRHRGLSDVEIIDGDDDYSIGIPSETYTTVYANQTGEFGHRNDLEVKVKTVAIEKANTLAIFNANTTFNGHYNDPNQRYTLIQLNIPDEGHYLGSESFLNEEIGTNSTNIDFVSSDSSDVESYTQIVEDVDGHSNVLRVQEGVADHSDFDHNFGSSIHSGTLEWWWRTSKISGGISYFYLKYGNTDVIRLFMREGKIRYHDGSFQNVMTASSNTWYRMKLVFGVGDGYCFDLYVDGVLKVNQGKYYNNQFFINKLRIATMGDPFYSYFDAFGYSWDSNYDVGDNNERYSVEGTPFEHGMNVIVVPTELFTHTKLNGYVENDNLDQTPLYHPDEHMFEFTAITRDGNPDKANADVDFLFTRYGISPEDAMDVLDLILWGCVNETLDESNNTIFIYEKVHDYVSTKVNGTMASEMGLPYSVLGYIPWFNTYTSSALGDEPEPEGGITDMLLWVFCLVNPILNVMIHIQMAMTRGAFYQYLVNFAANIFMVLLTALGDLLWTIVRAALLIFFYVMLAIEILFISIKTLAIGTTLLIIGIFAGINVDMYLDWAVSYGKETLVGYLEFTTTERTIRMESWVSWIYWDYFDLYYPWIKDNTVVNNYTIDSCERSILTSEYNEETFTPPPVKAINQTDPILKDPIFEKIDIDHYQFEVTYFDPNFESPDTSYGVLIHLISPNGTAIETIEMDTIIESPTFSSGDFITYNYTLDTSNFEDGLWHFGFSTKDRITGNVVIYPRESYFIGPDTSEIPLYLSSPRVSSSTNQFYKPEGWIDNNFTFYINWWDYINQSSPSEINLCIIPANISIGEGISNTYGIKKFQMSSVDATPNYSKPVEFCYNLNFTDWGYKDSEIGSFYHYFEAETSNGQISNYLLYRDNSNVHIEGPFVKSINHTTLVFDYDSTSSNEFFGNANTDFYFTLEYSDPQDVDTSSSPILLVSKGEEQYEYEMELLEISPDNRSCEYTICISGSDFNSGKYSTEIDLPENWVEPTNWNQVAVVTFYILDFVESAFQGIISTILNLGIIPSTMFVGASVLAILDRVEYFIPVVGGIGLYLCSSILTSLNAFFFDDNNAGKALGFSIGCLLLFIALQSCIKGGPGGKFGNLLNWAMTYFNTMLILTGVLEFANLFVGFLYPEDTALIDVLSIVNNFFNIFPMYFMFITIVNTLSTLLGVCNARGSSCTSIFYRSLQIYSGILICTALVGFGAFSTSLGMDIDFYAN